LSLWSYGIVFLGVLLGGMALLVIFSLLVMAHEGDANQDRLEHELRQKDILSPPQANLVKSDNFCASSDPDLVGVHHAKTGMFISR
jgi:hypothetical protein